MRPRFVRQFTKWLPRPCVARSSCQVCASTPRRGHRSIWRDATRLRPCRCRCENLDRFSPSLNQSCMDDAPSHTVAIVPTTHSARRPFHDELTGVGIPRHPCRHHGLDRCRFLPLRNWSRRKPPRAGAPSLWLSLLTPAFRWHWRAPSRCGRRAIAPPSSGRGLAPA